VEVKMQNKKVESILNRLHTAVPTPRDHVSRPPTIPESVLRARAMKPEKQEAPAQEGGEGEVDERPFWLRGFNTDEWRRRYKLKDDEWRFDVIPEIMDGKNIVDYVDPEIMAKLEALEDEEENAPEDPMEEGGVDLDPDQKELLGKIREKKAMMIMEHRKAKVVHKNKAGLPRPARKQDISNFESHLQEMGINPEAAADRMRSRSRSRGRKRSRSEDGMETEEPESKVSRSSRRRSRSKTPAPGEGFRDLEQKLQAEKIVKQKQKLRNKDARKGEGDRVILNMMPKHLFTGKRKGGKTQRR
jgi:nucleolar GTP-binding protein